MPRLIAFVAVLATLLLVAAPARADVSRTRARSLAVKAAGTRDAALIVFGLPQPLHRGTLITEARPARRSGGTAKRGGVRRARAPRVLRVEGERAWLFYLDQGPYLSYEHPGRVVLVGRTTGRVTVSRQLRFAPLVGGALPAFLRSRAAYSDPAYRVLYRPWRAASKATAATRRFAASTLETSWARRRAADLLAEQRTCVARFSDTLGDFYDFAGVDTTRATFGVFFQQLAALNPGLVQVRYTRRDGLTPRAFLERLIAQRGCRQVILYAAGGGYRQGPPAVNLGTLGRGGDVEVQDLLGSDLAATVDGHRDVSFSLILDAPYAERVGGMLSGRPNVAAVLTPGGAAFGYLPEVESGDGRRVPNTANPQSLLEFTNRVLIGLERFASDPDEVAHAALEGGGALGGVMLVRSYQLAPEASLSQTVEGAKPPVVDTPVAPTAPPRAPANGVPEALSAAVSTPEDTAVALQLAGRDPEGDPLTVEIADGPRHGTLSGAGLYTPGPDFNGADRVTFTVTDGHGARSAAATIAITVTPVDDPAQLTTSAGAAAYTEDGAAVAVDPGLDLTDVDSATLTAATVRIDNAAAGDRLAFTPAGGIGAAYANGTLTLTGAATLAAYRAALRAVSYSTTSDTPSTTPRTVSFAAGGSAPASRTVTVAAANDAPAVTLASTAVAYAEGDAAVALDAALTVADPDSSVLAGAEVQIASGYAAGEDELSFTPSAGITGSLGAGTLTLSGSASAAAYQAVLRTVRYRDTSPDPDETPRGVRVRATDGEGDAGAWATRTIDVAGVISAPVVTTSAGSAAYAEGDPATAVDPGLTVTDSDSAALASASVKLAAGAAPGDRLDFADTASIAGAWDATAKTLTLTGTASVAAWQAALRTVGFRNTGSNPGAAARTIAFHVNDGDVDSAEATRAVAVSVLDDAPVVSLASGHASWTEGDAAEPVDAALTVSDGDSAQLDQATIEIASGLRAGDVLTVTPPAGATQSWSAGTLTLSGAASLADWQAALRTVAFRSTSEDPGSATRTVSVRVRDDGGATSAAVTRAVQVTPVDDAPAAAGDAVATNEDTVLDGDVRLNDADPDDARSTLVVDRVNGAAGVGTPVTTTGGATLTVAADGTFHYDPRGAFDDLQAGQQRTDAFTYRIADPAGATATATATITVAGVDDAPVAGARSFDAAANTLLELQRSGVAGSSDPKVRVDGDLLTSASDADDGTPSADAETVASARGGSATIAADGTFAYVSAPGETASGDSFTYHLHDAHGASVAGTVTVNLRDRVWYVRGSAPAGGADGSGGHPFPTVGAAVAAAGPGDLVYVQSGTAAAGVTLKAGQRLIGQGEALSVNLGPSGTYTVLPAGAPPVLTGSTDVVALASGSVVRSLDIDPSGAAGGLYAAGGVAGATVRAVRVNDQGTPATDPAIELSGSSGTFSLTDVAVTTQSATGLRLASAGTVNIGGTSTIDAHGGPAVDAVSTAGALALASASSSGSGSFGLRLQNAGSFSAPTGAIAGSAGNAVDVDGGSTFSYGGTIANGGARAARIVNRTAATTLSGSITGAGGTGISVTSSPGTTTFSGATARVASVSLNAATAAFTGGGLATGSLQATGGGTLTVTGAGNAVDGALTVQNTAIGAAGLTFQRVSGGALTLDGTGSAGGASVAGGTLSSVSLTSTRDVSLSGVTVSGGLTGTGVTGFSLLSGTVAGPAAFSGLYGSALLQHATVHGGLQVLNDSGTLDRLTLDDATVSTAAADGLLLEASGSAIAKLTVAGSRFTSAPDDLLQVNALDGSTVDVDVHDSAFSNSSPDMIAGAGGVTLGGGGASGSTGLTYDVRRNTFRDARGTAVTIAKGVGNGTFAGTFADNAIGVSGDSDSGSSEGSGLVVDARGAGSHRTAITGNHIYGYADAGIWSTTGEAGAGDTGVVAFDATVTGNTLGSAGAGATSGYQLNVGATAASATTACLNLSGNALGGSAPAAVAHEIYVRQRQAANTIRLPGYAGGAFDTAAVQTYLLGRNTASAATATSTGAGPGFVNSTCQLP